MGAVTVTNRYDDVVGNKRVVECDLALSASYATGGDTLSPASVGLRQIDAVSVLSGPVATFKDRRGNTLAAQATSSRYIRTAGTASAPVFQAFSGTTEVTAATNLANQVYRVRLFGV